MVTNKKKQSRKKKKKAKPRSTSTSNLDTGRTGGSMLTNLPKQIQVHLFLSRHLICLLPSLVVYAFKAVPQCFDYSKIQYIFIWMGSTNSSVDAHIQSIDPNSSLVCFLNSTMHSSTSWSLFSFSQHWHLLSSQRQDSLVDTQSPIWHPCPPWIVNKEFGNNQAVPEIRTPRHLSGLYRREDLYRRWHLNRSHWIPGPYKVWTHDNTTETWQSQNTGF